MKIGITATLLITGFFALITNAQVALNQTGNLNATGNYTLNFVPAVSYNNTVNSIVNNDTVNATTNSTTNTTITQPITTPTNSAANATQAQIIRTLYANVSVWQGALTLGQPNILSASAQGGQPPYTYSWFETVPNTEQAVPILGCGAVSRSTCQLTSSALDSTGDYSFYVSIESSDGQVFNSTQIGVFVYPGLNLGNLV